VTWQELFDRAEVHDVTEAAIREAVAELRDDGA